MSEVFPEPIRNLPKADIPLSGIKTYSKGDHYFIPKGTKHSGKIYVGYADISFFNQKDRYKSK